jgi:hypothetical protein
MAKKKQYILYFILALSLFGLLLANNISNSAITIYNDSPSDSSYSYTEILSVSVDNSATLMIFKTNLNTAWNITLYNYLYAFISVNNATGTDWGWFTDFLFDYAIAFYPTDDGIAVDFRDIGNSSNDLENGENKSSMGYGYFSTNDNKTAEFGWRLKRFYEGKGYLNLSYGQVVYIKFRAGFDCDYAPDRGAEPIKFTLEEITQYTTPPIPSFEIYVISIALFSCISFYIIKKRYKKFQFS